jgi:hypothetical protein
MKIIELRISALIIEHYGKMGHIISSSSILTYYSLYDFIKHLKYIFTQTSP